MLDCLILGDSIAVGVGQARPVCETVAKTGITSGTYVRTVFAGVPRAAHTAVISLGVNDDPSMNTAENLRLLRRELRVERVVWLLPGLKDHVRRAIGTVAAEFGDRTLDTRSEVGPDHLHPTGVGYRVIAGRTELPGGGSAATMAASAGGGHGPFLLGSGMGRPVLLLGPGFPVVHGPGLGLRYQSMPGAGSAYEAWPPPNAKFGAIPPVTYAYRAGTTSIR